MRQWEADARRIEQPAPGGSLRFWEIANGVFYRDGRPFLRFEGEGGSYDERTGRLVLEGAFRLAQGPDHRLAAADLVWEPGRQELSTARPVRLATRDVTVEAAAMTVEVPAGVAHFTGGVVVRQATGAVLRAPAADWKFDTGEVVLFGPATAEAPTPEGNDGNGLSDAAPPSSAP